jgi:parvulin-like peptidyl-prolyl isomerase
MGRIRPLCILAVGLLLAAAGQAADPAPDDVAARVNGAIIHRDAVRAVVQALAEAQDTPPDGKQIERLTRDALDSLIAFELLYQESQKRGVAVTDADVDADVSRTKARFANADAYDSALQQRGLSAEDVRRDTRKTLAVNALLEQTAWRDITIPPEKVRRFYDENREQFRHPAEIRASHILIRADREASTLQRAQAQQQAEAVLAQLKAGADFAELARQRSQDPGTAGKGGDLGFFSRGAMEPTFEEAAFALNVGEISGVVTTPYGFHLIKVTDKRPAGYAPLAEVQADISAMLRDEEKRKRQDQLVAQLKQQATVDVLPLLQPTPAKNAKKGAKP